MNKPICIIIDFDDTLVESNTARDVLREYVSKEYDEIADLYKTKKVNFKNYQELSFKSALEISTIQEIKTTAKNKSKIRKGFTELMEFAVKEDINIVILSSGLNQYIEPVLEKHLKNIKIVAADMSVDQYKNVSFDYSKSFDEDCSDDWGICKCKTVNFLVGRNHVIYIGDGITTDLCASVNCDEIFALNPLYNSLLEKKISVNKFIDFVQIMNHITNIKGNRIDT